MRTVEVSGHALRRARDRRHYRADELSDGELADAIVADVRAAFLAGRCATARPRWTLRFREKARSMEEGFRAVWDEAEQLCWIVAREDQRDVVVTSMQRVVAKEAAA